MENKQMIASLIQDSQSPILEKRLDAIRSLGKSGDSDALEPLIACLNLIDRDWFTHEAAAVALGNLHDPRAIPALLSMLLKSERHGGYEVAHALGQMGEPVLQHLLDILQTTQDHKMRRAAAFALACMGTPAVESLIKLLDADQVQVRWSAITALGEIKDSRAVEPLLAMLSRSDWQTQLYIIKALGDTGDDRVVEPLIAKLRDPDQYIVEKTIRAISELGDNRALPELKRILQESQNLDISNSIIFWVKNAIEMIEKRGNKGG
jgi:HEAT repeat protein